MGPWRGRQLAADKGASNLFTENMFYSIPPNPDHTYGALARDGVSCAVCHQIPSEELGVDPEFIPREPSGYYLPRDLKSYTAMFADPPDVGAKFWGPYSDHEILSAPMDRALGSRAAYGPIGADGNPQIRESKLCGACHTVLVPALPVGYTLPMGITSPFDDPNMKLSFEQTTYFEWRNSLFENEANTASTTAITCQGCHMPAHLDQRIVNAESDRFPPVSGRTEGQNNFAKHASSSRHVLLGINYFVFEMYEQFPELTGALPPAGKVPEDTVDPLLNARDWIENHAKTITADVRVTALTDDGTNLDATVEVTNLAGHKFPTGAGFRRAFLRFEVLNSANDVLWASGRTTELGVLVGADGTTPLPSEETIQPGMSQPHHQIITNQNQVQIYETRALNSNQELQTTVLGIYYEYKDNRIPPLGYQPVEAGAMASRGATAAVLVGDPTTQPAGVIVDPPVGVPHEATEHPTIPDGSQESPFTVVYDPDYWLAAQAVNGQDHIGYRIPLTEITGWAKVRVQLFYQTIPPYYLRDRFETGKAPGDQLPKERDMNRLIHMASRLNLDGTPGENWSLAIGEPVEVAMGETMPTLDQAAAWEKIKQHYKYLNLPDITKKSKKPKGKKRRRKK